MKKICQYLPILIKSGAHARRVRRKRRSVFWTVCLCRLKHKDLCENPHFHRIASNALMYTHLHFWRNVSDAHECYFWNKFQKCLLGNIPKPLQNATRAFCKNVVKNRKAFSKIWCDKKSSSVDFLLMFLHTEKFVSWKSCVTSSDVL